jgi:hypothetical protein
MESIRIILDDAPENLHIPESLQHRQVEVIFRPLDTPDISMNDIENACNVLQADHTVNLEQMESTIKRRGSSQ